MRSDTWPHPSYWNAVPHRRWFNVRCATAIRGSRFKRMLMLSAMLSEKRLIRWRRASLAAELESTG